MNNTNLNKYLQFKSWKGLKNLGLSNNPIYRDRLSYELDIICKMGFAGYFLIVQDLINWARKQGIICGPGRGSAAGSLVTYSLGITLLDPIKFELFFERFLNPSRMGYPDFSEILKELPQNTSLTDKEIEDILLSVEQTDTRISN